MAGTHTEAGLTAKLKKNVTTCGGALITISGNRGVTGQPDRILYHRHWVGLMEIKVGENTCSEQQQMTISRLREKRPWACVVVRLYNSRQVTSRIDEDHWDVPSGDVCGRIEDGDGTLYTEFVGALNMIQWLSIQDYRWQNLMPDIAAKDQQAAVETQWRNVVPNSMTAEEA